MTDSPPWTPLLIAVAPTGARKTKADHPALPMAAAEIALAAAACRDAGAAMIHLHVRDRDGGHLLDAEAYREATRAIRAAAGEQLIVQVTSEAAGRYRPAEQMAVVRELEPEAVSLAIREIVPDEAAVPEAASFLAWLHAAGILPQYILYSADEVGRFRELCRRGVIPGDRHFLLFVLGRYAAGGVSEPAEMLPFLAANDGGDEWALCAFGRREQACVLAAAALGGHARVGFENNCHLADGTPAPDNAHLVAGLAEGARLIGRPVADAAAAREMLCERPSPEPLRTVGAQ